MKRTLVVAAVVWAVVLGACSGEGDGGGAVGSPPSASSASAASPTAPNDVIEIESGPLPVPEEVATESVTAVAVASSGLDIDADLVDASEQVEADLLAQATAATGPQGARRPDQGIANSGGMSAVGLLIDIVSRLTTGAQTPYSSSFETSTSPSAGGTLKMGATVSGDGAGSTSTEITFESKVESEDGRTVTQRIRGSVTGPVCPDEFGLLDLEISGEMEVTGDGPQRSRHTFTGSTSATFDDNGEIADVVIEMNVQSDRTASDGRAAFVDATFGWQVANLFGAGASTATERPAQINRTSQIVQSDPQQADRDMIADGRDAAMKFVLNALTFRRTTIQNNGCVLVVAEAPGTVAAEQVVPIEAKTRHVVEGVELDKRIEATLSGQGSIDPSSLPTTPDTIEYTAGQKGSDSGTVSLVSRSRRGIGTTALTIRVADKYRVDAAAGVLRLQGAVCSLDAPFTVSVVGEINGTLTFTPSGPGGGTYAGSADLGGGSMTWSGAYTVVGRDGDSPSVDADDGTTTVVGPISQQVPSFWEGGPDFPLLPDASACP